MDTAASCAPLASGDLVRIFFDTEFTGLTDDAALISIGMVDEARGEFYAEFSDTYLPQNCSQFCRSEVLPHLERGSAEMTLAEGREKLSAWLKARGPGAVLVCDSPRDVTQIRQLFPDGLPPNVSVKVLGWWGNLRRRVLNRGRRIHRKFGLRVHHSLDDARVNRIALL